MSASEAIGDKMFGAADSYIKVLLQSMDRVITELEKINTYRDVSSELEGLNTILKYIKKGGHVQESKIPTADQELFASALKSMKVPYSLIDGGNGTSIFITRDIDQAGVKEAFNRYAIEKNIGVGEMDLTKFINLQEGKDIASFDNLDAAELNVLKHEMSEKNITYAASVIKDEDGNDKFTVYCSGANKDEVEKSLKNVCYDFSGEEGQKYHTDLLNDIRAREKFSAKFIPENKDDIKYIFDKDNPSKYISIKGDKAYLHSIDFSKDPIEDVIQKSMAFHKADVMKVIDGYLKTPVVVDKKDIQDLIKDTFSDGRSAFNTENFKENFNKLAMDLSERTDVCPHSHVKDVKDIGKIYTLQGIPDDKLIEISNAMKEANMLGKVAFSGHDIAYSDKDKYFFDKIVDSVMFKNLSNEDKMINRLYLEGRGDAVMINNYPKYIIDIESHGHVKFTEKGMDIDIDDHKYSLSKDDPKYESYMTRLLNAMKDPVILTEAEYNDPTKDQIISRRAANIGKTPAIKAYKELDDHFKQELYEVHSRDDVKENFSGKQKEAVKKFSEHIVTDRYVDRTFVEKIMDGDVGRKLKQETRTTEVER